MEDHTLDKLQFSTVLERLAEHCACSLGQALARAVEPSRSVSRVEHWLAQVGEMLEVQPEHGLPPMGGIRDVKKQVARSSEPAGLEADALIEVMDTLRGLTLVRSWLEALPDQATLLKTMASRIGDFNELVREIDRVADSRGRVRDSASEKLASLRSQIESTRARTLSVFDRILKNQALVKFLQYPRATLHDDRLVLPLKAEQRGRINGIIHRSSDSGATLFVEPSEAVELNNAIIKLRFKEHEEITRILSAIGRLVHRQADDILSSLKAVSVLDLIAAKVRFAKAYDAICPTINHEGVLDLHAARHPALIDLQRQAQQDGREPNKVVPIDIRVGEDFDLLVITGPNTGGKTVALKTVGLLAAMTQAGIPIPVDPGSTLPVYKNVFLDVGDEQSIEQSLSTFSSHLSNILSILQHICEGSLVLIDELGSGTDPDEGAAIGWSIMDRLLASKCSSIVTTHLAPLKAVAYTLERVDNASVEFDVESLKPTYVLRVGEPGNSNALVIAERLGMPKKMVHNARLRLTNNHRALTKAIEGTLKSRRLAEEARKVATQKHRELERSKANYEAKSEQLEKARQSHEQWMLWIKKLAPGDLAYVQSFDKCAKVVRMQLHKQSALVSVGSIDLEVPLNTLAKPAPETVEQAK